MRFNSCEFTTHENSFFLTWPMCFQPARYENSRNQVMCLETLRLKSMTYTPWSLTNQFPPDSLTPSSQKGRGTLTTIIFDALLLLIFRGLKKYLLLIKEILHLFLSRTFFPWMGVYLKEFAGQSTVCTANQFPFANPKQPGKPLSLPRLTRKINLAIQFFLWVTLPETNRKSPWEAEFQKKKIL